MEIVNFETKYYEELLAFSKRIWPDKPEEYLKYRLFQIPEQTEDNKYNLLVKNDEGKIIGCTLYFPSKARINGKEEKMFWGHDVFVEEQYRGIASMLLFIEMSKMELSFGTGATDINYKIQKKGGANFLDVERHYLIFNIWFFKLLLIKLKLIRATGPDIYSFPDILKIGNYKFIKVSNVNELRIPNNGYWNEPDIDIDFVRDEHFLRNRFFENYLKYHFYKLENNDANKPDECYFVVRPTVDGGLPVISIVDFRSNLKKPEQFKLVLKAGAELGKQNRLPLVTVRTTSKLKKLNLCPLVYRTGSKQHITGPLFFGPNTRILVTCADSDTDFLTE
ncbi:MAG: GNAT family N-acetyltransferase [Bacteroidales bacterium]|nr:GNAT family N-acetyltransferase [Bacteroidales bacterium]